MDNLTIKKYNEIKSIKKCISTCVFIPNNGKYTSKMNAYLLGFIKNMEYFERVMKTVCKNKGEYWKLRVYYDSMFDYNKFDSKYPDMKTNSTYKLKSNNTPLLKKTKKAVKKNIKNKNNNYNYIFNAFKYYISYIKKNLDKYKFIELYSYELTDKKIKLPGHDETFGSLVRYEAFFDNNLSHVYCCNIRSPLTSKIITFINKWVNSNKKLLSHKFSDYNITPTVRKSIILESGKKTFKTIKNPHFKITYDIICEYNNIEKKRFYNSFNIYRYLAGVFGINLQKLNITKLREDYNKMLKQYVEKINYAFGIDEYILSSLFYYDGFIKKINQSENKNKKTFKIPTNSDTYYINYNYPLNIKIYNYPFDNIKKSINFANSLINNIKFMDYNNKDCKINFNRIKVNVYSFKSKNKQLLYDISKKKITLNKLEHIFNSENDDRHKFYLILAILHNYYNTNNKFINYLKNIIKDTFYNHIISSYNEFSIKLFKICDMNLLQYTDEISITSIINSFNEFKPLLIYSKYDIGKLNLNYNKFGYSFNYNVNNCDICMYKETDYFYTLYNYSDKSYKELINYCIKYYENENNILLLKKDELNKLITSN
jgi:hypothetical protein